jgi:hypothetical protein
VYPPAPREASVQELRETGFCHSVSAFLRKSLFAISQIAAKKRRIFLNFFLAFLPASPIIRA